TPVLKNIETNEIICDSFLICEYLTGAEIKKNLGSSHFDLLCLDTPDEYEVKRLQMLFDKNFFNAVTGRVIEEIFINTFQKKGKISNSDKIMAALNNFERHVKYIEFLLGKRKYLGGESFSIADISAAAQISVLDYLGMADWEKHEKFKEWYISIKQKIGFRKILEDKISGFEPNVLYNKLDF
ncbi:MAG: glutathione S-transferase domain-containing protein, partial [Rickettsiales bacterium]|nr:glutathione S-transferase domain-containing protein [Rickettsiales bacterium]